MVSASAVADVQDTYGAAFIGLCLSTVLYGVAVTQAWVYCLQYRHGDSIALKGYVALLMVLGSLHTALCLYSVYWYLIANYGNVGNLDLNMWAINIQPVIGVFISALVQLFYARQIYIVNKKRIIPGIIITLVVICLSLVFVYTVRAFEIKEYSRYGPLIWVTITGMGLSVVTITLIAASTSWYLYHNKMRFLKADSLVKNLVVYSVNTGVVMSVIAIIMLVTFASMHSSMVSLVFWWTLCNCYINSFLAILNTRDIPREWGSNSGVVSSISFNLTSIKRSKAPLSTGTTGATTVSVDVHQTGPVDFSMGKHNYDEEAGVENSV